MTSRPTISRMRNCRQSLQLARPASIRVNQLTKAERIRWVGEAVEEAAVKHQHLVDATEAYKAAMTKIENAKDNLADI